MAPLTKVTFDQNPCVDLDVNPPRIYNPEEQWYSEAIAEGATGNLDMGKSLGA